MIVSSRYSVFPQYVVCCEFGNHYLFCVHIGGFLVVLLSYIIPNDFLLALLQGAGVEDVRIQTYFDIPLHDSFCLLDG